MRTLALAISAALAATLSGASQAQQAVPPCEACAEWNRPQTPYRIFANTYYAGARGLSAILITSRQGHVLIDAALPESAGPIAASVRALGFKVEDIRVILNSHAHFDHAGGIAELQRMSGATVRAMPWSAAVLRSGTAPRSDPQFGIAPLMSPARNVELISDGGTVRVGPVSLTAHATPGHTPGGTSWTWRSCEGPTCIDFVYADSLTAVSADGFLFTRSLEYPNAIADFERSFRVLEGVSCGILLTPHPEASRAWMKNPAACRMYADAARERLSKRLKTEAGSVDLAIPVAQ